MLEETHHYPFGLTMAGISSKAAGKVENRKNKFQGQEYNDDLGVDLYEFKYRMDDPQTGRFWSVDPLADDYVYNSTYAFSENKVTSHIELEGLEAIDVNMETRRGMSQAGVSTAETNRLMQTYNTGEQKAAVEYGIPAMQAIPLLAPLAKWLGVGVKLLESSTPAPSQNTSPGVKPRNAPALEGTPNSSKIEAKDETGKTTKYSTYDKDGKLVKQIEGDKGTTRHGQEGATKKVPTTNIAPDGTVRPGKLKLEKATPEETPPGNNKKINNG